MSKRQPMRRPAARALAKVPASNLYNFLGVREVPAAWISAKLSHTSSWYRL